ncbi:hypothetical protein V6255_03115 [Psychromonas arctica]|uniref:Uncharacterized protein n=1 Tax=Psychromonas arctica TaxID=168275 RepID=A0ABU9H8K2_9GAMM
MTINIAISTAINSIINTPIHITINTTTTDNVSGRESISVLCAAS